MAGTIPISLTTQFDSLGRLLVGGKVYFYQAGTVATPQNAFQDSALTLPWANPITLDASARVPQLFFADGTIKVRIADTNGVTQFSQDGLLVIGASSGAGAAPSVDPTTLLQTGVLMPFYGTGNRTGFVRANGRTIGSATSGASERANPDSQTLFEYLWNADANLVVSTGRGVSSIADWSANKMITLPDWRGRALAGLDDMGNAAAGRLTATYFGTSGIVLGAAGGNEKITAAQIPAHQHGVFLKDPGHSHALTGAWIPSGSGGQSGSGAGINPFILNPPTDTKTTGLTVGSVNGTANDNQTASFGSGTAAPVASPAMLATIYIKL